MVMTETRPASSTFESFRIPHAQERAAMQEGTYWPITHRNEVLVTPEPLNETLGRLGIIDNVGVTALIDVKRDISGKNIPVEPRTEPYTIRIADDPYKTNSRDRNVGNSSAQIVGNDVAPYAMTCTLQEVLMAIENDKARFEDRAVIAGSSWVNGLQVAVGVMKDNSIAIFPSSSKLIHDRSLFSHDPEVLTKSVVITP